MCVRASALRCGQLHFVAAKMGCGSAVYRYFFPGETECVLLHAANRTPAEPAGHVQPLSASYVTTCIIHNCVVLFSAAQGLMYLWRPAMYLHACDQAVGLGNRIGRASGRTALRGSAYMFFPYFCFFRVHCLAGCCPYLGIWLVRGGCVPSCSPAMWSLL